ncbi:MULTISPECIES: hypothetical protein [Xanthobacter]|uniref:hypothetical protein n=1 Tax=Xanthobacter TaxID=279 RepID=UPI00068BE0D2|nr:hypothetical protein [Xanthobacter sp. 91]MCL8385120.1 hypothetical protein [Xanthobacter aminoxidans]
MSGALDAVAGVLGYAVPWWAWGIPGALAVAVLLRLFGVRAAGIAAAVLALVLVTRRAAQRGYDRALKEGERDVSKSLSAARSARDAAARRDGDARRLRDDDGFRRD